MGPSRPGGLCEWGRSAMTRPRLIRLERKGSRFGSAGLLLLLPLGFLGVGALLAAALLPRITLADSLSVSGSMVGPASVGASAAPNPESAAWTARLFVAGADASRTQPGDSVRATVPPLSDDHAEITLTGTIRTITPPTRSEGITSLEVVLHPALAADQTISVAPGRALSGEVMLGRIPASELLRRWYGRKLGEDP